MSMSGTAVRCKMCETRNGVKRRIHASLFFFFLNTQFIFEVKRFPYLCSLFTVNLVQLGQRTVQNLDMLGCLFCRTHTRETLTISA